MQRRAYERSWRKETRRGRESSRGERVGVTGRNRGWRRGQKYSREIPPFDVWNGAVGIRRSYRVGVLFLPFVFPSRQRRLFLAAYLVDRSNLSGLDGFDCWLAERNPMLARAGVFRFGATDILAGLRVVGVAHGAGKCGASASDGFNGTVGIGRAGEFDDELCAEGIERSWSSGHEVSAIVCGGAGEGIRPYTI